MKRYKKILKRINPLTYINGVKGAISLFMAVLLIPFLSIAMILVDVGKYNSTVSIVDESMGISSNSLLSNYDSYLKERWGLLGLSQDVDMEDEYSEYFETNTGILGDGIKLNSLDVAGEYPLSDQEVLKEQILEFCKLNAPTTLANDFLDLSSLLDCFSTLKTLGKITDLFTNTIDATENSITFFDSVSDLKKDANKLESLKSKYDNSYTKFSNAVNNLINLLKAGRPEDEDKAKEYDRLVSSYRSSASTYKTEYSGVLQEIIDTMTSYKQKMSDSQTSISKVEGDIVGFGSTVISLEKDSKKKKEELDSATKEVERLDQELKGHYDKEDPYYKECLKKREENLKKRQDLQKEYAELQLESGMAGATKNGLSTINDGWNDSSQKYNEATFGSLIEGFKSLKTRVDGYSVWGVSSSSSKISTTYYKNVSIGGYVKANEIDAYVTEQENDLKSGGLKAIIDGITSFFNSIFKFSLLYDASLSANIDIDYYETQFGGLPGSSHDGEGVIGVVRSIGSLIKDMKSFGENISTLKIVSALKNIVSIIKDVKEVISSITTFAKNILDNIASLLTGYDKLYLNTYAAFNLPCRTDKTSGAMSFSAMTGYSLKNSSLPDQNVPYDNVTHFGDIAALIDAITSYAKGTGDDITFSGAELEYVLFGSNSEIANQLYVFCSLYIFRLIMDIIPVLTDPEIQSLAAASTFGYPVVMAIMIFAEPLADVVLLVNGGEVPFWETDIYLSPTGLPGLIENLVSVCKFSTEQKESIKSDLVDAFGATDDDYDYQKKLQSWQSNKKNDPAPSPEKKGQIKEGVSNFLNGLISFDYREYCFLMMLITVGKDEQVARISNLIQMETLYHYNEMPEPVSFTFDLRKSYSFLEVDTSIEVKQFLPSLTDSSLFKVERKCFRGY